MLIDVTITPALAGAAHRVQQVLAGRAVEAVYDRSRDCAGLVYERDLSDLAHALIKGQPMQVTPGCWKCGPQVNHNRT